MQNNQEWKSNCPPSAPPAGTLKNDDHADPSGVTQPRNQSAGSDLPFDHLLHYEVVEWIGRGEMGDVYRGYERALDRTVALKVLRAELSADPELVRRFHTEASAAARVIHPNVIPIHFIGEDNDLFFLAMQHVDGGSLVELLDRRGRLNADETLDILEQVVGGLAAAHRQGLIHRDIKPGNILLDRAHQRALLTDFGLAKSVTGIENQTATEIVMGNSEYMSPEQGRGLPVDHRCDLYAVGVLAYRMLIGRLPYSGNSPTTLIFQHVYEPVPPLNDVPPALAALVTKLMAKSPESRCASAESLLAELRAIRSGYPLPSGDDMESADDPLISSRGMSDEVGPLASTIVIRAPQFPVELPSLESVSLSDARPSNSVKEGWRRLRARWNDCFRSRTPEWIQQLQSTQQQIDGAIAEHECRRDQLLRLAREADEVLAIIRSALQAHPDDTELKRSAADQEEQLGEMKLRLSQVEITLGQLCNQRDLLQVRFNAARANLHFAGNPRRLLTKRVVKVGLIAPCVIAVLFYLVLPRNGTMRSGEIAPAPDLPLITEILKAPTVTVDLSILPQGISFGSADGLLGVVNADSSIELRDGKTGQVLNQIKTGAVDSSRVVIDKDGNHAASLVQNGPGLSLSIRDTRQGKNVFVADGLSGSTRLLGFAGTPLHLMLAEQIDEKQSVLIRWPLDGTPPVRRTVMAKLDGPVAFDSTGRRFAITRPGRVLLGELPADEQPPLKLAFIPEQVTAVVFHPHDGTLMIGNRKGAVTVWDFALRQPVRQLVGSPNSISALGIDSTGRWLAASDGEQVRIWDLGLLYVRAIIPVSKVTSLAFSPQGKQLALATDPAQVQFWNTDFPVMDVRFGIWLNRLGQEKSDPIRQQYASSLQLYNPREATTRDGRLTVAAPADTIPFVKDAKTGKMLYQFEGARPALGITVSSDDRMVVTGSYDANSRTGDVRLWDLQTGRPRGRFDGHIHYAWSVAFSNDDSLLLSGGRKMHLWDVSSQKELRQFEAPFSLVRRVAFSPDARRVTASATALPVQQHVLFDRYSGEVLLHFSGMPPEFVFGPPTAYADQRFGTVRELNKPGIAKPPAAPIHNPEKSNPQLPVATVKPVTPEVKVSHGELARYALSHPIETGGMYLPISLTSFEFVEKEAGITDEQKPKLAQLRKEAWDDYVNWIGKLDSIPDNATSALLNYKRAEIARKEIKSADKVRVKYNLKLAEVLDAAQLERIEQIALRGAQEHALSQPFVADALGMSIIQRAKVAAVHQEFRNSTAKLKGSHFENMGKISDLNQIRMRQLDALLTKEQLAKFEKMKGKEFDLYLLYRSKR